MFEHAITVLESHTANPYHHVHHADILRFLEEGRLAYLEAIGFPTQALMARDIFAIVASISVRFLREVRPGSHVVTCEQGRLEGKSLFVTQKMYNARNKIVVEAQVECVMMSGALRRAIAPDPQFVAAFTSYNQPKSLGEPSVGNPA